MYHPNRSIRIELWHRILGVVLTIAWIGSSHAVGWGRMGSEETPASARTGEPTRPNVLLVLADDLGFSDVGCYGGEIATPNLDRLASRGVKFSQYYNTARCWPTRASLLTGYYAQQVRRDKVEGVPSGTAGKRPVWAKLLPEYLQEVGYRSYHSASGISMEITQARFPSFSGYRWGRAEQLLQS